MSVERLDAGRVDDVNAVVGLHIRHLPDSPLLALGPEFLRELYYGRLLTEGLVRCVVGRVDGRVVAFLAYVARRRGLLTHALRRHPAALIRLLLRRLATAPRAIGGMLWIGRVAWQRSRPGLPLSSGEEGEALAMVVSPHHAGHVPAGGTSRLSVRLFEAMATDLAAEGIRRIVLLAEPSNLAVNIFLRGTMGCDFEPIQLAGKRLHRYVYAYTGHRR